MNTDALIRELIAKFRFSEEAARISCEDRFRCVYCGLNLLTTVDTYRSYETEHILPKRYAELTDEITNKTSACRVCNYIKRDWDPNTDGDRVYVDGTGHLAAEQRATLIARGRRFIEQERIKKTKELLALRETLLEFGCDTGLVA